VSLVLSVKFWPRFFVDFHLVRGSMEESCYPIDNQRNYSVVQGQLVRCWTDINPLRSPSNSARFNGEGEHWHQTDRKERFRALRPNPNIRKWVICHPIHLQYSKWISHF
jgi:hypothetical protein